MATQVLPVSETPTGKVGRVTGHIDPKSKGPGEICINIRGGSECYLARADNPREEFFIGEQVKVVDFQAPRTVYVERIAHTER